MKKTWWLAVFALIAIALLLAIGVPMMLPPTPGVTYTNYGRLEKGMTRAEVEALLGASNYVPREHPCDFNAMVGRGWLNWENADGDVVSVKFDAQNQVIETAWNAEVDRRTTLEKMRDRVPWLAKEPPSRWTERAEIL